MAAAPFLSVALWAPAQVSDDRWPVGPFPRPRNPDEWSFGHRHVFNRSAWRIPLDSSLYAVFFNFQAFAGLKGATAITLAAQDEDPLVILASIKEKTEGVDKTVGSAFLSRRADLRLHNFSALTITALVEVLWRWVFHYQPRKPLHAGTSKDEGQVFVKMLTPDSFQNRALVSLFDQKKCTGKAPDRRYISQGSGVDLFELVCPDLTFVRCRGAAHPSKENSKRLTAGPSELEPSEPVQNLPSDRCECTGFLGHHGCSDKQKTDFSEPFQILIVLLSGKSLLQWVRPSDSVQDLKFLLESNMGVPAASQRLLFEGKQLEDSCPLACYNIQRNASIRMSLRLRGGAGGQASPAATFSYKEAVHSQKPKDKEPPPQAPKPFLVDKLEETPSIELTHPVLDRQHQIFAENAIICRFNGLWPRTADLYQWVHANWTSHCRVLLCSKGFFITVFADTEDYQRALTKGPWFWNTAGLFLTPWFPEFDPATAVITKLPIWVRLPNLPAHLWNFVVFEAIGNSLGRYLSTDADRGLKGMYTFARICAEIDLSKGLPEQINLKIGDFHWTQPLDFENTAFRCRNCHLTGHLQSSCPSLPFPQKKAKAKPKSKSWKPHDPPPFDVFSSSDEENEEEDEEVMDETPEQVAPSARHEEATVPPISQKRTHESSPSGSDKELSPTAQRFLQIVQAQQGSSGWVRVGKKKGKKGRPDDSTLAV